MNVTVREERPEDNIHVFVINNEAFGGAEEADLVERLRKSTSSAPGLSLVAEAKGKVIGHILFSKCQIIAEDESWEALVLAPVAVTPILHGRGIGGKLIQEGLKKAKALGYGAVIVLGEADYYPRFGFEKASKWEVKCPFEVPDECFMAQELKPGYLEGKAGTVRYPIEFQI
ncbi:N-acetyltransferase [Fulvitalea axinellae]|uniref:N-acetyltransferase n=1 Tax=Fulvitalea axinellae TaxID=1182444 RepID=A0AAU9CGX4_9BACT|nr:N-acetyltransferase [Fulvitalea axinellae]